MTNVQKFTRVFGGVYVLVGIAGFLSAIGGTTSQTPNDLLGLFEVTVIHNIIHLGVGVAFLAASGTDAMARTIATVVGVVYLLVGILGVLDVEFLGEQIGNSVADWLLHLATAALALYFGLSGKATAPAA